MVRAYLTSAPGVTFGLLRICAAIEQFRPHLIVVIRLRRNDLYSFIALFREPNSVGNFTALINQEGAASGYGGGGPYGHAQILTFLDDNSIEFEDADWNDWESDYPDFIKRLSLSSDEAFLNESWSRFLSSYIWNYLPTKSNIKPSKERLDETT